MNISTTPVKLDLGNADVPLIQNLGEEPVYVGHTDNLLDQEGIKLNTGDALELASPVMESGAVWLVCPTGTSDVRVMVVG